MLAPDVPRVSSTELLTTFASCEPGLVTFDGDGTLWVGDVGDDVFSAACRQGRIRHEADAALQAMARRFGTTIGKSPSETAASLFAGYRQGTVPELTICEIMTWCYAGWHEADLRAFVRQSLDEAGFSGRCIEAVHAIVDGTRRQGHRLMVVSASPQMIVEEAAATLGFLSHEVVASPAAFSPDGICLPHLAAATPYAEAKVSRARERVDPSVPWLGAFGDNVFDLDMFAAARIAVAVRPKRVLAAKLNEVPHAVLLSE